MNPQPLYHPGESVLLRATKEMGRVEREPVRDGGEFWYRVRFAKRSDNVVEEDLEAVQAEATLESLAKAGNWGRVRAFRCALAIERLTNANQNTLYAFRALRILFEAFQYKPLLKFLESHDRRLLIADEVGLGKTVETGLILAELEARKPLERVLVVCPSRLRDKWRDEMQRKFDQEFDIYARRNLEDYLEKIRRNPGRSHLRAVVSMQTLRESDLRERFLAEVGMLDLVVVDEAHHARNPSSQTSEMLREVCEVAGAVLLLTATPLHLGTRDLFTLLQAMRPTEFRDPIVFDGQLRRYGGIHEAALLVRSRQEPNLARARAILSGLFETGPVADRDPLALQVLADLDRQENRDWRAWVELERRVQDLHPLSSIVTRTKKRDVHITAALRSARVRRCQWTPEEEAAYSKLVHGARANGWFDRPMSLGQIQRARQAASCLPAALLAASQAARSDEETLELTDILPGDLPTQNLPPEPPDAESPPLRIAVDSKFAELLALLRLIEVEEVGAKVLIFTYFVGTSRYLQERLTQEGYVTLRIAGDVPSNPTNPAKDERGNVMRQFRDDAAARIMVSTEVGSEGLDFQFCHYLVNYDLPWNPMVVEQRIGRIDRYGQKADKLHIFNLVVEGTVEDRILERLYTRLDIFEKSLGQMEAILGEEIHQLQSEYVSGRLTPEEADRMVNQATQAILQNRQNLEELEKNAGNLFGHEEYLKEQLHRVGRLGRYISAQSMLALIESFLHAQHPQVQPWEMKSQPGIYQLRMSDGLLRDIQTAASPELWNRRPDPGKVYTFCFDGAHAWQREGIDLINASHPFLKAAVGVVQKQLQQVQARVGRTLLALRPGEDGDLRSGVYFVVVFAHSVDSIRPRRILEVVVWSEGQGGFIGLEEGERLLHLIQERGLEWDVSHPSCGVAQATWEKIESEARRRNRVLCDSEKTENAALYLRRKKLLEAERVHTLEVRQQRLQTAEERGRTKVLPALEGQVRKTEWVFQERLAELERNREVRCRLSEPVAICLVEVTRTDR